MLPCPLSPPASVLGCLVSKDIKVTLSQCLISSEAQLAVGSLGSRGLCARSQGWAGGVLSEPAAPAQTQSQEPPCCSPRCGSQPRMPPTVPDSHKWVELVLQWEETLAVLGPGSAVNGSGGPSELGVLCMSPHPRTCHIMGGGSANSPHQVLSRPQAGPQQVGVAAVVGR